MRDRSFGTGIRIAFVLLAFGCGQAFGGFTDTAHGGEVTPPDVTDVEEEILEFSVTNDSLNEIVPPAQPLASRITPPAAAPLPVALLPGGVMIAGSWIATRVFKRRIV